MKFNFSLFIFLILLSLVNFKRIKPNLITKYPLVLNSCKDNILIKAPYAEKSDCEILIEKTRFFIINSKFINVLDDLYSKVLLNSFKFSELSSCPFDIIEEDYKTCLKINKKNLDNIETISLCLNDKKKIENILNVLQTFVECHKGNPIVNPKLKNTDKSCKLGDDLGKKEDGSEYVVKNI